MKKLCLVIALLGASLAAVGGAATAPRTTGVDPVIKVNVKLTDSRISLAPNRVARLQTVWFRIVNSGKRTHNFTIAGHATKAIPHAQVRHLVLQFVDRGDYLYRSSVHPKPAMHGYLHVYSPLGG
jgi:plastocyanin